MSTLEQLRDREEELEAMLTNVKHAIQRIEGSKLGKMPNSRAGFYHNHSASYECGIAYWSEDESDLPFEGSYRPCKKLVNHKGRCGFEDNTAY